MEQKNGTGNIENQQSGLTFNITSQTTHSLSRRKIRNLLLRRRSGYPLDEIETQLVAAILLVINEQIAGFYTLDDFTWEWDIHPTNSLKVVTPMQWVAEGGGKDPVTGMRYPPAFTKQEK